MDFVLSSLYKRLPQPAKGYSCLSGYCLIKISSAVFSIILSSDWLMDFSP